MNLTDLPNLMDERYESDGTPVLAESRIDGIQRRVTATRRRRTVGTLVAVVVAVTAAIGLPRLATHPRGSTTPAAPATVAGFPLWAEGGNVIGAQTGPLSAGSLSLTVTFSRLDYGLAVDSRCTLAQPNSKLTVQIALSVNGTELSQGSCGSSQLEFDPTVLANASLKIGVPAVVRFTITGAQLWDTDYTGRVGTAVPAGTISMAVRQRVPFEDYQLPPRPDPLPSFNGAELVREGSETTPWATLASGGDPLAPISTTITWPHVASDDPWLRYDTFSQTPGYLQLSVDGVNVGRPAEFWGYYDTPDAAMWSANLSADDLAKAGVHVRPGDTVTLTVVPRYVSGAWVVDFQGGPTH